MMKGIIHYKLPTASLENRKKVVYHNTHSHTIQVTKDMAEVFMGHGWGWNISPTILL